MNVTRTVKVEDHMYPNWRLDIDDESNEVRWVGVEGGPLTLHAEDPRTITLKEHGHSWYMNQYQGQLYEPAKFIVLTKNYGEDGLYGGDRELVSVTRLTEFYIKAGKNE